MFFARARQYERQLARAGEQRQWEATGLSAVHLAIASIDAVTCAKLGKVWSGEDHSGVVDLLRETGLPAMGPTLRQVASVLEAKTRVEYGAEPATAEGAELLAKQARRIYEWAVEAAGPRATNPP